MKTLLKVGRLELKHTKTCAFCLIFGLNYGKDNYVALELSIGYNRFVLLYSFYSSIKKHNHGVS